MSALSVMLPDGDFLRVADPRDAAGQRAWERGLQAALDFAREPSTAAAAKLLSYVAESSDIGDPTKPGWLPALPAAKRAKVLEELQQLVASWNRMSGRHTDGTPVDTVKAAQSAAAALRLAADQAGPQRPEFLHKAALADQQASSAEPAEDPGGAG